MDAMSAGQAKDRLAQLWQWPLLLFSLGLFIWAGILLIRSKPVPSVAQQLRVAQQLIQHDRPDAARDLLGQMLASGKLSGSDAGAAQLLLAEALDATARLTRNSSPARHRQIVELSSLAERQGIELDAAAHRRVAQSLEALGRLSEAVGRYRRAMTGDPQRDLPLKRKLIELHFAAQDNDAALAAIQDYLAHDELTSSERAWAMGEQAHALIDRGQFDEARRLLLQALALEGDDGPEKGRFNYWLGYCHWKLGEGDQAERYLRVARDQLGIRSELDADAAYALGRIHQERGDYAGAISFYASVLQGHLDSPVARLAQAGRGVGRIATGSVDAGLSELGDLVRYLRDRQTPPPTLVEVTIESLREASALLAKDGNYEAALEAMGLEQKLLPAPDAAFFLRLARLYEQRAQQLAELQDDDGGQQQRRQEAMRLRSLAADAYLATARAVVLLNDQEYGLALWKAIGLYDAAGDLHRTIATLETFTAERPGDPLTPDALLRLGALYHTAGLLDKAVSAYRRCQFLYPRSLAASKAGVPLARAYMARGPEFQDEAEQVLRSIIENNPQVTPAAQEFRDALFELAGLYYRAGRFEPAIARLEELAQRYPQDPDMGQMLFLMADAYRKSAAALAERIADAPGGASTRPAMELAEISQARRQRLTRARDLFTQVIEHAREHAPQSDLERLYLKLSYFLRAGCVYDLGDYQDAIRLFDDAAFRYQDDPAALAAYVQIVNANVALGRTEEARAANERAKWMLSRMPAAAFNAGAGYAMPREQWQQWLEWSSRSGLWNAPP